MVPSVWESGQLCWTHLWEMMCRATSKQKKIENNKYHDLWHADWVQKWLCQYMSEKISKVLQSQKNLIKNSIGTQELW